MRPRAVIGMALCVGLAVAFLVPALAFADSDPPSDFLVSQDAYLPYPTASNGQPTRAAPPKSAQLNHLLAEAKGGGHAFKVAVIATPVDLGGVPALFGKPGQYAKFLHYEIQPFAKNASLVVVMQQGLALVGPGATPAGKAALARVRVPSRASSQELTAVAVSAVRAVTAADRDQLATVDPNSDAGGGSGGRWVAICGLALLLLGGLTAALLLRRRARTEP
jgi:hypothetical protein